MSGSPRFCYSESALAEPTETSPGDAMTALATEPVAAESALRPAGFWIRVVATLIDGLFFVAVATLTLAVAILTRAGIGASAVLSEGDSTVAAAVAVAFYLYFLAAYYIVLHGATGQTLGKMAVGVRVVSLEGGEISYGVSFVRWVGYFLSTFTFLLGYLMVGVRADKRALHDLVAGTRVVRVR